MNKIRLLRLIYGIIVISLSIWFGLNGSYANISILVCLGLIAVFYFAEQKAEKIIIKKND